MNEFLSIFLTWQFLVLCVGIAAITFVIRTLIEYMILNNPKMPGTSQSRFWRDFVLVVLPIVLGMLFPFVSSDLSYPALVQDNASKFLFSASAGLLSPTLYRVIKALLWKNVSENSPQIVQQFPVLNNLQNQDAPIQNQNTADDQNPQEPKV